MKTRSPFAASRARSVRQAGFSLVELLVTVVIMAEILVGVAILFESSNRVARAQTHLAELQQSLRVGQAEIVRFARMAGIGGLPITRLNLPAGEPNGGSPDYDLSGAFPRRGIAVALINNVPAGSDIVTAVDPTSSESADGQVLAGSDVLILRGVFSTPLYYFDPPISIEDWNASDNDLANSPTIDQLVIIPEKVRVVGDDWEDYPQDLQALSTRLERARLAGRAEALILRDTLNPNAYAIMEFDHAATTAGDLTVANCPPGSVPATATFTPQCIQFYVRIDPTTKPGSGYGALSQGSILQPGAGGVTVELDPTGPVEVEFPTTFGSIGLLEEYRLFLREEREVPGDPSTRLAPVLSRASFLPGTDLQIDRVDIADNVIDLQIAVGADSNLPGTAGYGDLVENDSGVYVADEILFNEAGDTDATTGDYIAPPGAALTWYDPTLEYHFLRINTLVQSRFPDPQHLAPGLGNIEDYNRGATITSGTSTRYNDEVKYHRRWLQTVVELRNLL